MRHLTLDHHGKNGLTQLQSRHQGSEDVSLIAAMKVCLANNPQVCLGQRETVEIDTS